MLMAMFFKNRLLLILGHFIHFSSQDNHKFCCGNIACIHQSMQIIHNLDIGNYSCSGNPRIHSQYLEKVNFKFFVLLGPSVTPFVQVGPTWISVSKRLIYDFANVTRNSVPPFLLTSCEMTLPGCDQITHSVGWSLPPYAELYYKVKKSDKSHGKRPLDEKNVVLAFLGGSSIPDLKDNFIIFYLYGKTAKYHRISIICFISFLSTIYLLMHFTTSLSSSNSRIVVIPELRKEDSPARSNSRYLNSRKRSLSITRRKYASDDARPMSSIVYQGVHLEGSVLNMTQSKTSTLESKAVDDSTIVLDLRRRNHASQKEMADTDTFGAPVTDILQTDTVNSFLSNQPIPDGSSSSSSLFWLAKEPYTTETLDSGSIESTDEIKPPMKTICKNKMIKRYVLANADLTGKFKGK